MLIGSSAEGNVVAWSLAEAEAEGADATTTNNSGGGGGGGGAEDKGTKNKGALARAALSKRGRASSEPSGDVELGGVTLSVSDPNAGGSGACSPSARASGGASAPANPFFAQ